MYFCSGLTDGALQFEAPVFSVVGLCPRIKEESIALEEQECPSSWSVLSGAELLFLGTDWNKECGTVGARLQPLPLTFSRSLSDRK